VKRKVAVLEPYEAMKEKPFGKDLLEYIQVLLGQRPAKPVHTVIRISPTGDIDIQSSRIVIRSATQDQEGQ